MNTTTLAKRVGVSSRTIRKWIKQYNVTCEKNEHGHYLFTEDDVQIFSNIFTQIKHEKKTEQRQGIVIIQKPEIEQNETYQGNNIDHSTLTHLIERLEIVEQKIETKASDVVVYQLLQHRREIEELTEKLHQLEKYVAELEAQQKPIVVPAIETAASLEPIRKPRSASRKKLKLAGFLF